MALKTRTQQPTPVSANVELPPNFPAIPQEILDRFQTAADWQKRLDDFWSRTGQALQEAQQQAANYANSRVTYSVDQFLIYAKNGSPQPMFALDDTGIRLGNVLVINTPALKMYIGAGTYQSDDTPFYVDVDGKFSLGSKLTWDPVSATLTITGTIIATSGTIGGFDIGADYIRDAVNSFGLASTVTGGDDVRFWAGATFANRALAPLRIYESGNIFATYVQVGGLASLDGSVAITINGSLLAGGANLGAGMVVFPTLSASVNGNTLEGVASICVFNKNGKIALTAYGLYTNLDNSAGAGTIDRAYGLYIGPVTIGTTNYGIYSEGGNNVFIGGINSTPIGATTPSTGAFTTLSATGLFTVNANGGSIVAGLTTPVAYFVGADGTNPRMYIDAYAGIPIFMFRRADTSLAAKSAVQNGDGLGSIGWQAFGATAYSIASRIIVQGQAAENWSDTAQGTRLSFQVTPNATIVPASVLTLDQDLSATFAGTIKTGAPTGGAGLWKLGKYTAGVLAQAGSVLVNVDGVDRVLLTA